MPADKYNEADIDLTKYSKVYTRKKSQWVMTGYQCRTCYSKISAIGRVVKHHDVCVGKVSPAYRNIL
jgi:NAD(P)H-nitrite reductase large subunit